MQARSGLSRPTVLKALATLEAAGWCARAKAIDRAPEDTRATVPADLVGDGRVGAQAKVLYGVLQLTPGCQGQAGQFTPASLSSLTGASRNANKRAIIDLVQSGWLQVTQPHRLVPVGFTLGNPEHARGEAEVARARRRLDEARPPSPSNSTAPSTTGRPAGSPASTPPSSAAATT